VDESGHLVSFAKITRDLTDKRAVYEALRQGERRFRHLMESVHHHVIYTIDPKGLMTSWNPDAERIKGYSSDEILGPSFSQFYTPEDQADGKPFNALETARTRGRFEEVGW
jgi:PAS domain S-box-containing protein